MAGKIFCIHSFSSTILLLFLLCLIQHIQISNGLSFCEYHKPGDPLLYLKQCPDICCPFNSNTLQNTTCCNSVLTNTAVTTTYTIFGCRWWIVFLSGSGLFCALCILVNYSKRKHVLQNWKTFNSVVGPSAAFTISKNESNINPVCYYSAENNAVVFEQNPPSYPSTVLPPPPPYTLADSSTKKVLE